MNGSGFWKPESMYSIVARSFPVWYILSIALRESRCICASGIFSSICNFFSCCSSILLFCYDLSVPIFSSKIVLFPLNPFAGLCQKILHLLATRMFSLFWNVLFCLYCIPSIANTFWFISSSCIFCSNCFAFFLFVSTNSHLFFYRTIFACCCWFLIGISQSNFPSAFWLSVCVLKGIPDFFSQTNLAPA